MCENCVEIPEELAAKCTIHNNSVTGNEKVDTFQSELGRKLDVIKSMEMAQNTLRELIDDKDETIRSQKQIEGIQNDIDTDTDNTRLKLEEACEIITGEEMAILSVSHSAVGDSQVVELTQQLESERQNKLVLAKKLEKQGLITKATELAFSNQTELINAKNEIIQNFKIIISQHKKNACSCQPLNEGDLTSHLEPTNSRTENKNGVQDCFDFIKIHATNGVLN